MQADFVGFSMAIAPGQACYVPIGHRAASGAFDFGDAPSQAGAGGRGAGRAAAAARGPLGAQDRAEPEIRLPGAGPAWHHARPARRHHAAVLCAGRGQGPARHGHAVRAPSRAHLHPVHAGARACARRQEVRQDVRPGAARQGHRVCGRGCRRHAAAVARAEAAAGGRAGRHRLRDAGAADGVRAGRHGAGRRQGRPQHPLAADLDLLAAQRAAGGGDLRAGRPQVQPRLAQAARRVPVRQSEAAGRQEDQERAVGDAGRAARRSRRPRGPARVGAQAHQRHARMAADDQADVDLYRRAAALHQCRDGPHPHLLCARLHHHGPAVVQRAQPAEHPDPHQGGPRDPHGLHRRQGPQADLGRLQPDRAAHPGAHRRHPAAAAAPSPRGSTFTP